MHSNSITFPQPWNIETLKERFQILPNGFSVDYKNNFQMLFLRVGWTYPPAKDYLLPTYETYVEEKVSIFQPYNPDIDARNILLWSLSQESLREFNIRVWKINDLVSMWEDAWVVKNRCFDLIRDFMEEKVQTTMEDTLAALERTI